MERHFDPTVCELMDMPSPDPDELRDDLHNLETLNRSFGATRAMLRLLAPLRQAARLRVLDLACGFADIPRAFLRQCLRDNQDCRIVAVDSQLPTLRMARAASTGFAGRLLFVQADTRHLPFKDGAFDAVTCSLALHHFSAADARAILQQMKRLAARTAVAMDLVRGPIAYAAVWLLTQFIFTARMTRHDARLSICRAFSNEEFRSLAREAGWPAPKIVSLPWFRQAIVLKNGR